MGDSVVNIVCGDCGSADCQWASINRGIFLCNECSFIHRSLGPQYSRVKSLTHSNWHPNLRKMVTTLASGPANNVLEHSLLDPSKSESQMKKPVPGDSLELVKKRFITMKHAQLQFVLRQKVETFDERNEELHSTVRTGDLGVSLRLITSGADPNFFHPERGTRPLHVACRSGQALQVELLFIHGAQIDAPDYLGQTPAEHALAAGFKELANRIEELRYHLTDQLSFFVCGETPDHTTNKHILIPFSAPSINCADQEDKIKSLPSYMLEQLTADLYDEVDRRQTEKLLVTSSPDHARFSIAFLPVHSNYPSVRNQTRQKFAKITDSDLSSLIITILREGKRRHFNGSSLIETDKDIFLDNNNLELLNLSAAATTTQSLGLSLTEDDEFPLYDSVASDDDVVMSEPQTIQAHETPPKIEVGVSKNLNSSGVKRGTDGRQRVWEVENLKYELKVAKLMLTNSMHENMAIRAKEQQHNFEMDRINSNNVETTAGHGDGWPGTVVLRQNSPSQQNRTRSVSMYVEQFEHINKELPVRPNTADASIGKQQQQQQSKSDVGELVQSRTREIVELIKVLMEYARTNDTTGVELTANKVYDAAEEMASVLLRKEYGPLVKKSLENVLVQVLRMKSEIPLLTCPELLMAATGPTSAEHQKCAGGADSELYVQKIRQLCFDVGAAMKRLVQKLRNEFECGTTLPLSFRLNQLERLERLLKERREEILAALAKDLRKPRHEGILYEIEVVENELSSMMKNLRKYTASEILPINALTPTDQGIIRKEPYGVVLIVGSWNFPFLLCLQPLIGAIAAGNVSLIKPSEVASASAETIARLLPQYLHQQCYQVVLGGIEETQDILKNKFDFIFFTGSSEIAKHIMAAASTHLTPVVLECGGKNPCYIDDSADIEKATKRIIWGKFINSGQACISVDYIVCSQRVRDKFLQYAFQFIHEWYDRKNPRNISVLSRIINKKHFKRLSNILEFVETSKRGVIAIGGRTNEEELTIEPTVIIDVQMNDMIMDSETFGPILPVITVNDIDDAITSIRHRPNLCKPLVVYSFAGDERKNEKFLRAIQSGGVCINDVVLHTSWSLLPFGGVGTSGMGAIHGKKTFDTFTHQRSVLHRGLSNLSELVYDSRYPPYTDKKVKFLSFMLKHFDKFFIARHKLYRYFLLFVAVCLCIGFRRLLKALLIKKISMMKI